jgi:hypothetical protein
MLLIEFCLHSQAVAWGCWKWLHRTDPPVIIVRSWSSSGNIQWLHPIVPDKRWWGSKIVAAAPSWCSRSTSSSVDIPRSCKLLWYVLILRSVSSVSFWHYLPQVCHIIYCDVWSVIYLPFTTGEKLKFLIPYAQENWRNIRCKILYSSCIHSNIKLNFFCLYNFIFSWNQKEVYVLVLLLIIKLNIKSS